MKVNFVTIGDQTIASYRYHNEIPARELMLSGHDATVTPVPELDSDVYVFSKHFNYGDYWYMKGLKSDGKKIVFHCCDNHFGSRHEDHYRRMMGDSDLIIVPTPGMFQKITEALPDKKVAVIPDTFEYPQMPAQYQPSDTVKLLWFGHPSNMKALQDIMPLPEGFELRLCTLVPKNYKFPLCFDQVAYMSWSYENLIRSFIWCDVVIIPFHDDEKDNLKSPNRLMESVRRGKFVIASSIPSYEEFKPWMWIGDIREGLEWIKTQADIEQRISECQKYIEGKYNPARIGKMWEEVLKK